MAPAGFACAPGPDSPARRLNLLIVECGPDAAPDLHRLTRAAFAGYGSLDPPSGALRETEAEVREDLEAGGGALARLGGRAVGCLRFEAESGYLTVRRVAVDPDFQGQGIGRALMEWAHEYARARGFHQVRVGVRSQLPGNRAFYERLGYHVLAGHSHEGFRQVTWYEMTRELDR